MLDCPPIVRTKRLEFETLIDFFRHLSSRRRVKAVAGCRLDKFGKFLTVAFAAAYGIVCALHPRYLCIVFSLVVHFLASPCLVLSGGLQPRKGRGFRGGEGCQRRNIRHHHQLGLRHQRSPVQGGRGNCFGARLGIIIVKTSWTCAAHQNPFEKSGGSRL